MNYHHAFHAGNFADVLKHSVLVGLLEALARKPAAFCYVDTHAGAGRYDLAGAEAAKTGEAAAGVLRLADTTDLPGMLGRYVELMRALDPSLRICPGSPLIAARLLREQDRAQLFELQPAEAAELRALFRGDPRIGVHERDGYAALKALLPPREKRGLVLIDPPFEAQEDEFRAVEKALDFIRSRWAGGVVAIWYPIKLRRNITPFHRWLRESGLRRVLAVECMLYPETSPLRLNGCGMAIVNTPWQFERELDAPLAAFVRRLGGTRSVEWLVPD